MIDFIQRCFKPDLAYALATPQTLEVCPSAVADAAQYGVPQLILSLQTCYPYELASAHFPAVVDHEMHTFRLDKIHRDGQCNSAQE